MLVKEKLKIKEQKQQFCNHRVIVNDDFRDVNSGESLNEYIKRFPDGSKLILQNKENKVELYNSEGNNCLSIEASESGLIVNISGLKINIQSSTSINFDAEFISLHSKTAIQLNANTDIINSCKGNMENRITGAFIHSADENKITSELGDLVLKANDNISLIGEKVLLNCE